MSLQVASLCRYFYSLKSWCLLACLCMCLATFTSGHAGRTRWCKGTLCGCILEEDKRSQKKANKQGASAQLHRPDASHIASNFCYSGCKFQVSRFVNECRYMNTPTCVKESACVYDVSCVCRSLVFVF